MSETSESRLTHLKECLRNLTLFGQKDTYLYKMQETKLFKRVHDANFTRSEMSIKEFEVHSELFEAVLLTQNHEPENTKTAKEGNTASSINFHDLIAANQY